MSGRSSCSTWTACKSIALASRDERLLWTDDLTLAALARQDFGCPRRAWTQVVLQAAVEEGVLQQTEFDGHSARLIGLGYSSTSCNPAIVLQAGGHCRLDLRGVAVASGHWPVPPGPPPPVKVAMAAHAIVGMFRTISSPFVRQPFILAILNQLGSRRLALALAAGLEGLFGVDGLSGQEAVGAIRA